MNVNTQEATLVIKNAKIWTANPQMPFAQSLAISGTTIIDIGLESSMLKHVKETTRVINAKGMFITPGFIDSHVHLLMGGERLNSLQLKNVTSLNEFSLAIGHYAKSLRKGDWILGGDWDHMNWGGILPSRFLIDDQTRDNPVWIGRHEGHTYLANSLALKLAGLSDDNIPKIQGGTIEVNKQNKMTGIFKDNALRLVFDKIPIPSEEESFKFMRSAMEYFCQFGVTSVHHMTEPVGRNRSGLPRDLEIFEKFEQSGEEMKTRIYAAVPIELQNDLVKKMRNNQPGLMVRFGAVKGYADGSIGSHTAAFFDDYIDTPGYNGDLVNDYKQLYKQVQNADKENIQVFIHAIGDRGIHMVLDIFEQVIKENGEKDRRWRIEHAQHISLNDFKRFKELGVIASVQPQHAIDDSRFIQTYLDECRGKRSFAYRSLLDNKAKLALGSDWFVSPPNPLLTIHAAINREYFLPEESITLEESLYAHTLYAAYSVHEEHLKGSLEVGKLADLVIIDKNLFEIDKKEIRNCEVVMTILGGNAIFKDSNHFS
jgi:predicted amidohydrolase YtcJ